MLVILSITSLLSGAPPLVSQRSHWDRCACCPGPRILAQLGTPLAELRAARRETSPPARHLRPDHRLQRLYLGVISPRHPIHRRGADGGRPFAGNDSGRRCATSSCRKRCVACSRRWGTTSSPCSRIRRWSRCWGCRTSRRTGEGVFRPGAFRLLRDVRRGGVSAACVMTVGAGAGGAGDRRKRMPARA